VEKQSKDSMEQQRRFTEELLRRIPLPHNNHSQ